MKKIMTTLIAIVAILSCGNAFAQEQDAKQNYIEVSTRAEEQITPDIIYLNITINEATNNKIALEAKEREMIKTLQRLGIDIEKALTVNDMSSNLKKYFLKKDDIVSIKNYQLKLKDAKEVAAIFEALNSINIPDVDIARCAVSPELEQEVKNRLLVAAAQKAKENATILAEAVGSKAGNALFIQNYYNFSQPAMAKVMSRGALYATAANEEVDALPALEVTKTTISINVTCHFALLP